MASKDKDTVRLTVDFPARVHIFLKMAAAKEGKSMREYIIESLMYKMQQEGKVDLDEETFQRELAKMKKKDAKLMKNLSER